MVDLPFDSQSDQEYVQDSSEQPEFEMSDMTSFDLSSIMMEDFVNISLESQCILVVEKTDADPITFVEIVPSFIVLVIISGIALYTATKKR